MRKSVKDLIGDLITVYIKQDIDFISDLEISDITHFLDHINFNYAIVLPCPAFRENIRDIVIEQEKFELFKEKIQEKFGQNCGFTTTPYIVK